MSKLHEYGYNKDLGDKRDHRFQVPEGIVLPLSVDLRSECPPIEDQRQLSSCTSFAGGAAIRVARKKQGLPDFITSHLFLYYNSRRPKQRKIDDGASLRDMIKAAAKFGDCDESMWAYDISKFADQPPIACYHDALKDRAISYQRVAQSIIQMKTCLTQGFPFVMGVSVYESFESPAVAATGIIPMPLQREQFLGGHAILACGYDTTTNMVTFRNSWSDKWGDKGYGHIPFDYLLDPDLASDFWTIHFIG